ncbi:MAG: tetratricopeptide repeat protein [Planctomycetota bacterium]|nr:tetratricopeptide repeat protein [Planctomycetota bacterium]
MNKKDFFAELDRREQKGDFDAMLELLDSTIAKVPGDMDYFIERGRVLEEFYNSPTQGLLEYERAHAIEPSSQVPLQHICLANLTLNDNESAMIVAEKALDLAPDDATSIYLLGLCRLNSGQTAEAIELLRFASEKTPEKSECWTTLGHAYSKVGEYLKSLHAFQLACGLCEDSATHISKARIYVKLGDADNALKSLDFAAKLPMDANEKFLAERSRENALRLKNNREMNDS